MTTTYQTAARTWQALLDWQPGAAAAIVQWARELPEDWPRRVFGVGRPDAAAQIPPAAEGEQFADQAPEIAPHDPDGSDEECPACLEAETQCRWHEGHATAGGDWHGRLLTAVKADKTITVLAFLQRRADESEAEDRGEIARGVDRLIEESR